MKNAFTLIELLVVIAIIGVLASIVFVALDDSRENAKIAKTLTWSSGIRSLMGVNAVGIWDFNEGSYTTAYDMSGCGNNGAIHGATPTNDTPNHALGKALSFDGNDYVDCGNVPSYIENVFTIEAWIYPTNMTPIEGYGRTILATSDRYGIWLLVNNGKIRVYAFSNNTTHYYQTTATPISLNQWNHIVVSAIRNGKGKIYANGQFVESFTAYNDIGWQGVFGIGDLRLNRQIAFNGLIDEVRIYNEALPEQAIREHYLAGLEEHQGMAKK